MASSVLSGGAEGTPIGTAVLSSLASAINSYKSRYPDMAEVLGGTEEIETNVAAIRSMVESGTGLTAADRPNPSKLYAWVNKGRIALQKSIMDDPALSSEAKARALIEMTQQGMAAGTSYGIPTVQEWEQYAAGQSGDLLEGILKGLTVK
jgi:hypothetical protein